MLNSPYNLQFDEETSQYRIKPKTTTLLEIPKLPMNKNQILSDDKIETLTDMLNTLLDCNRLWLTENSLPVKNHY